MMTHINNPLQCFTGLWIYWHRADLLNFLQLWTKCDRNFKLLTNRFVIFLIWEHPSVFGDLHLHQSRNISLEGELHLYSWIFVHFLCLTSDVVNQKKSELNWNILLKVQGPPYHTFAHSAQNNIFVSPGTSWDFLTISHGHFKPLLKFLRWSVHFLWLFLWGRPPNFT